MVTVRSERFDRLAQTEVSRAAATSSGDFPEGAATVNEDLWYRAISTDALLVFSASTARMTLLTSNSLERFTPRLAFMDRRSEDSTA